MRGAYRNGWLCSRPDPDTGKLAPTQKQSGAHDLKLGSHMIFQKWLKKRGNLDEQGFPKLPEGE